MNTSKISNQSNQKLCDRTYFIEGDKLFIEESYIYEYKNYSFPIKEAEFVFRIKKAVCSFLNSPRGGIIYFGIDDDSEIKGVQLKDQNTAEINLKSILESSQINKPFIGEV